MISLLLNNNTAAIYFELGIRKDVKYGMTRIKTISRKILIAFSSVSYNYKMTLLSTIPTIKIK
jgi:hypothetical protein